MLTAEASAPPSRPRPATIHTSAEAGSLGVPPTACSPLGQTVRRVPAVDAPDPFAAPAACAVVISGWKQNGTPLGWSETSTTNSAMNSRIRPAAQSRRLRKSRTWACDSSETAYPICRAWTSSARFRRGHMCGSASRSTSSRRGSAGCRHDPTRAIAPGMSGSSALSGISSTRNARAACRLRNACSIDVPCHQSRTAARRYQGRCPMTASASHRCASMASTSASAWALVLRARAIRVWWRMRVTSTRTCCGHAPDRAGWSRARSVAGRPGASTMAHAPPLADITPRHSTGAGGGRG